MKINFLFLCVFFSFTTTGQKHSISINYKPSFTYFGRQNQRFDNYYFFSRNGGKTFSNAAAILYSYRIASKMRINTGLEYSQQGQNIIFNADSVYPSNNKRIFKVELSYLRIPLTIECSILKRKNSELSIYSGLSFGISAKRKDNYQNIIIEDILLPPADKRYKNQDWAIPIGVNYQIALAKNIVAHFGAEYLAGLTNSFTDNAGSRFGVLSEFDNSKQKRISIIIGMGINLANK